MASQVAYDGVPSAQGAFQSNYNLDDPVEALSSYSRSMHKHTQHQMDVATRASPSRRRSSKTSVTGSTRLSPISSNESVEIKE